MIAPASRNLGKYEIRQKLGRGGMADVYLALDTASGHDVALKLIEHADDIDTRDSIEAERRGAELQARLAEVDDHVVKIFDAGDIDSYFYVAMEYVEGQDLHELMRKGPLESEFAADVAIAVAETLENAHNLHVEIDGKEFRGIVHGDIKPRNIRIDNHARVRVLDFGIAKALSLTRRLTRNEFGSVPYSSPERLAEGHVDSYSDLWALAVMLYEMATGLPPYQADTTERLETMIRSLIPPPPAPDPCPEPLRRILVKAMMPDPELRYATAREFADDLIMFRTGGPVRAVTEDLEATRRTFRRVPDETRRTISEPQPGDDTRPTSTGGRKADEVLNWPPQKAPAQEHPWVRPARRAVGVLMVAGLLLGAYEAIASYVLYKQGQKLESDIQTEQVTDLNDIWNRWSELSKDDPSSFALRGARKAVRQKMIESADRVIASYRNNGAVYENGWKGAHDDLSHALALGPDDSVRGKLRLTEGHLARLGGAARHNIQQLDSAAERFTEAQRLLPGSPDPELGLARVQLDVARAYVAGHDLDSADEALRVAEKRAGTLGNRDKELLADAYRDVADRRYASSFDVRDLPQEKEQLQRARDDDQRSLEIYQAITPFGNAGASLVHVQNSLERVNSRLQEIDTGTVIHLPAPAKGAIDKFCQFLHICR